MLVYKDHQFEVRLTHWYAGIRRYVIGFNSSKKGWKPVAFAWGKDTECLDSCAGLAWAKKYIGRIHAGTASEQEHASLRERGVAAELLTGCGSVLA